VTDKYTMRISLNALKHLGIGLYSNIPAVISEAVANAWDADASNVSITIETQNDDHGKKRIIIEDDGHGMSVSDTNEKYLCVGYERRKKDGSTTESGRPVMGRKGIGKLSLFSIADTITIHSVKDGERHGLKMSVKSIRDQLRNDEQVYHPEPLNSAPDLSKGTRITLTDLKPKVSRSSALRKRLARRFSVIGDQSGFNVDIDGKKITAADRGYDDKLQYKWTYDGVGSETEEGSKDGVFELEPEVQVDGRTEKITGWIGTAEKAGQLNEDGYSINRIVIMVRGKMAQEDILEELGEGGIYSKYVIGEICADFLDEDDREDISTTNRQKIVEDDVRYRALKEKIKADIKKIQNQWTDLRNKEGKEKAFEVPQIKNWYNDLETSDHKAAEKLFGYINRLPVDSDDDKRKLYIAGVLAFESLKLRNMLDKLNDIEVGSPDTLKLLNDVFLRLDDLEAAEYYRITKTRLDVVDKLSQMTDNNEREKVIQKHIFDHLWIVDPSWEAVQGTEMMERRMTTAFQAIYESLTEEEKRARVDIKYRSVGNRHVIVELKRPDVTITVGALIDQIKKYRNAAYKILNQSGQRNEHVEFVCVLGKNLSGDDSAGEEESRKALSAYNARIVFYDQLIHNAEKAHSAYIEKQKKVSRIYALITDIDNADVNVINSY